MYDVPQVRAELQRHVTTMGQCSASIEARLQDALAAADQRLGRQMEDGRDFGASC